ncbi:Gag protease polyprotein [Gossypium australe]|uniref:Gag protease polyprotein n=1 Tax=Gossypium australe TaxID=47621 RepID=A0A5B6V9E3_9ROSI|nr:Gag protease polyprotein [Gossypium australe]
MKLIKDPIPFIFEVNENKDIRVCTEVPHLLEGQGRTSDRLTKSTHFLAMHANYKLEKLTKLYIPKIVRLHSITSTIVSERDLKFTLRFWKQ